MKKQALKGVVVAALWVSSHLLVSTHLWAEPLTDLQARLASLRNDRTTRIKVEVELRHKRTAPLHLSGIKKRGQAIVAYGPTGVKMIDQRWFGSSNRFSAWRKSKVETEIPLLDDVEAVDLIDPASTLELLLSDATLLSDETVQWKGRPARYLAIRPGLLAADRQDGRAAGESDPGPLTLEVGLWLDETGAPLAMERSMELRFALLTVTEHQAFTFQQFDGRLLVDEARETFSGTALAVLRGRDEKKMKVTALR